MVYVGESLLPQGGEGLFAKKDIPKKNLLCLYNGVRLSTATLYAKYSSSDYRIRLNADVDLDIPSGSERLSQYCATLGHKINHSLNDNAEWALVEHPRFGLIRGINTRKDIKKDDEILINYQMNLLLHIWNLTKLKMQIVSLGKIKSLYDFLACYRAALIHLAFDLRICYKSLSSDSTLEKRIINSKKVHNRHIIIFILNYPLLIIQLSSS